LASQLFNAKRQGLDLSVGTMVAGWDDLDGVSIWYVDNNGKRLSGKIFSVGSGSTYALGVLDSALQSHVKNGEIPRLSLEEALEIGKKAIKAATYRDGYSGGFVNVYVGERAVRTPAGATTWHIRNCSILR